MTLRSICLLLAIFGCTSNQQTEILPSQELIRLNQIGYYPRAAKRFVLTENPKAATFQLIDATSKEAVYDGELSGPQQWKLSGEVVWVGDFSSVSTPGAYQVQIEGIGTSYPFEINESVLQEAFHGSIKSLYYQRVSQPLLEEHAGVYARAAGHPDEEVPFHPSLQREGSIPSPGGWYDAGDFGKYVLNGAYPAAQLMVLLEQYPHLVGDDALNIPESGNGRSDLLDEIKHEMDWLISMQDTDGGAFHKLTTEVFEGMIMPAEGTKQRYVYQKGTAATLCLAAASAKFARLMEGIDSAYAETCLKVAKDAWQWAAQNPNIPFTNPEGVITGQYGDDDFSQEFYWAAAELFVTTSDPQYLEYLKTLSVDFDFKAGESWANHVHYIGAFALLDNGQHLEPDFRNSLQSAITTAANTLVEKSLTNAYFQPIDDFHWGSNSDVMNAAYIVAQAYRLDPQPRYLAMIQDCADYILGRNAVGYSFLTGYGDRTPMFIHHRQSAADGIPSPIPGLLSGGPNPRQQDAAEVTYPEVTYPMTSWVDQEPSYASNEICLNWNAPLTYVFGFLESVSE